MASEECGVWGGVWVGSETMVRAQPAGVVGTKVGGGGGLQLRSRLGMAVPTVPRRVGGWNRARVAVGLGKKVAC